MALFRFRSRIILTFAFLYFSLGNMHSRLDSSEQTMKEITLKDVLEQYHMKLEGTLMQRLRRIDFQKLFHLGEKYY